MNKEKIEKVKLMLINFKINYDYDRYYNEEDILDNIAYLESLQNPNYEAIAERILQEVIGEHLRFSMCVPTPSTHELHQGIKQAIVKILKESK